MECHPACSRLLTVGPNHDPLWLRLYVQLYANQLAAMLVGDEVPPPDAGTLGGLAFFGATSGDSEREAKAYLGLSEPAN